MNTSKSEGDRGNPGPNARPQPNREFLQDLLRRALGTCRSPERVRAVLATLALDAGDLSFRHLRACDDSSTSSPRNPSDHVSP